MAFIKKLDMFLESKVKVLSKDNFDSDAPTFVEWVKEWIGQVNEDKKQSTIAYILDHHGLSDLAGFTDDNQKMDLYMKYTDDIDRLLKKKYFSLSPDELGVDSLYSYITKGVEKAMCITLKGMV